MNKTKKLRDLIARKAVTIVGAHDGLSARLVEEAEFDGVWGSGFEISASHAVPDANILMMAENLHVTKNMNDSVGIPVLADCDSGYGNAINVVRMIEQYERAGIAGVCIEDNVFPKRCSFYTGVKRELESVGEFVGKIRAAKRAQRDPDFVVVARTEALIAGLGMEEALRRGHAYADAGADMVLIHSKSSSPEEVITFASQWRSKTPLVCVPTIYNTASADELFAAGFNMVIFANQGIRAAIKNTQETLAQLRRTGRASTIDDRIAPMKEVYRLMGVDQLRANEAEFLTDGSSETTAVIVAAGKGFDDEMMPLIADKPKSLLDVKGKTILERQIQALRACGIRRVAVVRGYKKDSFEPLPDVFYFDNDRYAETNTVESLFCAEEVLSGRVLMLYGDIVFDESILHKLFRCEADITLVVDHAASEHQKAGNGNGNRNGNGRSRISRPEMVTTARRLTEAARFVPDLRPNRVLKIGRELEHAEANGEFIGMALFSSRGIETLKTVYRVERERNAGEQFHEAESFERASFGDLVQELIDRGTQVASIDIYKGWMEVDTFDDYRRMWAEIEI